MKAITREEKIMSGENLTPITRKEMFLAKAAGMDVETLEPITREEMFLSKISGGGSGGGGGVLICNAENTSISIDIHSCENVKIRYTNATSVGDNVFYGCTSLASIDLPNVTSVGDYAFDGCTALASIDLPNVTSVGEDAFRECTSLASIDLPNVTSVGDYAFNSCTSLKSIDLPNVTSVGDSVFLECTSLKSIDLPNVTIVGNVAFYGCTSLDTVILRKNDSACNFNLTAILGTKIATAEGMPTGEGFIYVPTTLYADYVANFTEQVTYLLVSTGVPQEQAVVMAEQIAMAILRKIEDYPEIVGVIE